MLTVIIMYLWHAQFEVEANDRRSRYLLEAGIDKIIPVQGKAQDRWQNFVLK